MTINTLLIHKNITDSEYVYKTETCNSSLQQEG